MGECTSLSADFCGSSDWSGSGFITSRLCV